LDWIPFEILRSKNKGWIDPMGLTFPRMDQSNECQFLPFLFLSNDAILFSSCDLLLRLDTLYNGAAATLRMTVPNAIDTVVWIIS
jgi:hypothetical protein